MFICFDCGNVFDTPKHWQETHGLDTPPYEHRSGCPSCGGTYAQAYRCDCCDEWIDGDYIKTDNDQRICKDCYAYMELGDED